MCSYDDGNSAFQAKNNNICNAKIAKFGDLGSNGGMGKNLSSKIPHLQSPALVCLYSLCNFYGAAMMINSGASPLLSTIDNRQSQCH